MDKKLAEIYAAKALKWLAINQDNLEAFLINNGANLVDRHIITRDHQFLCSVLEFFMTSDDLIIKRSKNLNIKAENLALASRILSDETLPNWT
tara:strand:- start:475 stop:753 length:279 start_codon:yes stop_codon:yes gene_type:complete